MARANERQVGGTHYAAAHQHWDIVVEHQLNYFEAQILRYVMRARKKHGRQDLEKALHFLEKYLEIYEQMVVQSPPVAAPITFPEIQKEAIFSEWPGARPISEAPAGTVMDFNQYFSCEGWFGDMTQLYRCRKCRTYVRSKGLREVGIEHQCLSMMS